MKYDKAAVTRYNNIDAMQIVGIAIADQVINIGFYISRGHSGLIRTSPTSQIQSMNVFWRSWLSCQSAYKLMVFATVAQFSGQTEQRDWKWQSLLLTCNRIALV